MSVGEWIPLGLINDFRTTTSLVVPVYREDADVLERCLRTWVAERPTEIVLVVDDLDELLLNRLRRLTMPTVRILPWRHAGKRGALAAGVYAATGEIVVFSDSDTSWRSYRTYLTALAHGWLWRQPLITQVTALQILATPLSTGAAVFYTVRWASSGGWPVLAAAVGWAVLGRGLRGLSHLRENPRDLMMIPLMALVVAGIALPVKAWAALTMNSHGWLTRHEHSRVEGQKEIHERTDPMPAGRETRRGA